MSTLQAGYRVIGFNQQSSRLRIIAAAAGIAGLFASSAARATTYYWDANGSTTSATGGDGTWDTASSLWRTGSSTGALVAWPNATSNTDEAVLAGNAGTLTLNSSSVDLNVNKITFGTANYTIKPPTSGTARVFLSGTAPTIDTGTIAGSKITAVVAGGDLNKIGSGQLRLDTAANTFSNLIVKEGMVLGVTNAATFGAGTVTIGDTTLDKNASISLLNVTANNAIVIAASGNGSTRTIGNDTSQSGVLNGGVTMNGNMNLLSTGGVLRLNGAISSTTTANIDITVQGSSATGVQFGDGSAAGGLINNQGTITVNALSSGNNGVTFQNAASIGSNVTSLIQNSATNVLTLNSVNTNFAGTVVANFGTVKISNSSALGAANAVSVASGATLALNTFGIGIGGLNDVPTKGGGNVNYIAGAASSYSFTLGGASTYSFSGTITNTNTMNLTKTGVGTQTLGGNDTYTGTTTISNGALILNGATSGGDSYTISGTAAGAGILGGSGSVVLAAGKSFGFSSTAIAARATLSPGDPTAASGVGPLTLGSSASPATVTLGANSRLAIDLIGATADKLIVNGTMSLSNLGTTSDTDLALSLGSTTPVAGLYTIVDNDGTNSSGTDGYGGKFRYNGNVLAQGATLISNASYVIKISYQGEGSTFDMGSATSGNNIMLQVTAVPEPASMALLGVSGIALLRRRRIHR